MSRQNMENNYGNGDSICKPISLFRDKHMHAGDLKTDKDGNNIFTENRKLNEEKYMKRIGWMSTSSHIRSTTICMA